MIGLNGLTGVPNKRWEPPGNATMSSLTFYIKIRNNGEFYWSLEAANKKKIATSGEGYEAMADCRHAIGLLVNGCRTAQLVDATGEPHEPLGRGDKLFPRAHDGT